MTGTRSGSIRPCGSRPRRGATAAAICALVLLAGGAAAGREDVSVGAQLRAAFSTDDGQLLRWEACQPSCGDARVRLEWGPPGPVGLAAQGDPALTRRLRALEYRVSRAAAAGGERIERVSEPLAEGVRVEQTYWLPEHGYQLRTEIRFQGPAADAFAAEHRLELELAAGREHSAPGAAGSAPARSFAVVQRGAVRELAADEPPQEIAPGSWSGVRDRFWAVLAKSPQPATVTAPPRAATPTPTPAEQALPDDADPRLRLSAPAGTAFEIELYAGPLERSALAAADPALPALLFSGLWFWMRWLCLGMLWLLEALASATGNPGLAVLALSVAVKFLLRPLAALAERWQSEVDARRSLLEPHVRRIRALYRGEEQSRRLFDLHREHGVHPLYGLKTGLGVLIQIPVFFAAYHTLDEAFLLHGSSFLWIADLGEPDRVASLPFALPFFGDGIHLLPFLMTATTLLASRLHGRSALAPELQRRERRSLYAMAAAFFALFYGFPSAMVLYWTTNNLTALLREQWHQRGAGRTLRTA